MAKPSALGERLKVARLAAGLSASGLSLAAGATRSVVQQIESGEIQAPRAELVGHLADTLGVSLDWLVFGRGGAPAPRSKTGTEG